MATIRCTCGEEDCTIMAELLSAERLMVVSGVGVHPILLAFND
jgi:hypothetical protein